MDMSHLWNDGDNPPEVMQTQAVYVDTVYRQLAFRFRQTEQGCDKRALSGTSPAYYTDL